MTVNKRTELRKSFSTKCFENNTFPSNDIYAVYLNLEENSRNNPKIFKELITLIWSDAYKIIRQQENNNTLLPFEYKYIEDIKYLENIEYISPDNFELVSFMISKFKQFCSYDFFSKVNCLLELNNFDHDKIAEIDENHLKEFVEYGLHIDSYYYIIEYLNNNRNNETYFEQKLKNYLLKLKIQKPDFFIKNMQDMLWRIYEEKSILIRNGKTLNNSPEQDIFIKIKTEELEEIINYILSDEYDLIFVINLFINSVIKKQNINELFIPDIEDIEIENKIYKKNKRNN
ncbi:MAG: hypothetical protein ACK5HP_02650 [Bacilli bacterium]